MNTITSLPAQLPKLKILDQFMVGHNGFIAGGCFKHLFSGETVKDIDIFFEDEIDLDEGINWFNTNTDYQVKYENNNVIAFQCKTNGMVVELIKTFFDTPLTLMSRFDFTITKAVYFKDTETGEYQFTYHERFFEHLITKKLVIDDQILFPLSTFNRTYRYTRYGFYLCGESKTKVVESLQGVIAPDTSDFYAGID